MSRLARAMLATGLATVIVIATALLGGAVTVAAPGRVPADVKATYDRQPELLERAFARLQPEAAPRPQLYFIGFAGYGGQAVFKREVLAVRQQFDARFGTKGRSLVLINHGSPVA